MKNAIQRRLAAAAFLAALCAAGASRASPSCSNISSTPVAFGTYNPVSATPTDSTGSFSYFCAGALAPVISINAGTSGTFSPRTMTSALDVLNYNLYADAARTLVWGDGTGGTVTVPGIVSTKVYTVNIYGRIFQQQSVGAGSFSDNLIVTINF